MNEREIRRTFELIKGDNALIEVRIINGKKTISGYFKNVDNLITELKKYDIGNIYFIFNKIKDECYHREQKERFIADVRTTGDADIEAREWLLIDIDGKRSAGISSTNDEKSEVRNVALQVYQFLKDSGFPEPISADSGNGYHLLYRIKMKTSKENDKLISDFLMALDLFASNEHAAIDKKVGNESRITKLYGTVARKGSNSQERPHRESRILRVPEKVEAVPKELILKIASLIPEPEKPTYTNNYGKDAFDLEAFITRNALPVSKELNESDHVKYILSQCVFDSQHDNNCACIFKSKNGSIGYNCFHNGCTGKTFSDVVRLFEPNNPYLYGKKQQGSYNKKDQIKNEQKTPQAKSEEKGEKFFKLSEIKRIDRANIVTIPSGITGLDKKIIGFNKGEISVWSGNNGSGKSTILSQVSIHAATNGFRGIIYSGELKPQRVKDWVHLQAAGKQYAKEGKFEGSYFVPHNYSERIDLWLNDLLWVYNNKYGNTFTQLLADIEEQVKLHEIDYIVLDNLMSLDLDFNDYSQFDKQKRFIVSLAEAAQEFNIHIHLVAHPRKSTGFLRKIDISGSADLTNRPDNVFIVHRVNNDFIKSVGDFFDKSISAMMSDEYDNVIEVCKNRDIGIMDELIGTYFEKESRRFLNTKYEAPIYGWQSVEQQTEMRSDPFDFYAGNSNHQTPF
jgi:hypothetical protein